MFNSHGDYHDSGTESGFDLVEVTKYGHIKKGDQVIVGDGGRRYFAGVDEYGRVLTFADGGTEWSSGGVTIAWGNCRLAEDDE